MKAAEAGTRQERTREAIHRLMCTMRLHRKVVEKRIDGLGVHQGQHRMLMTLSRMGRTLSQKDVAEALEVSPACVARTLKALEAAGLIGRAAGEDSRRREIDILPAGEALVEDSIMTFRGIAEEMFEGVSDPALEQLTQTLERIYQNLSRMEKQEGGDRP